MFRCSLFFFLLTSSLRGLAVSVLSPVSLYCRVCTVYVQSIRTLVLGVVKSIEFKDQDYFGTLVSKRSCRFGTQESILQVA